MTGKILHTQSTYAILLARVIIHLILDRCRTGRSNTDRSDGNEASGEQETRAGVLSIDDVNIIHTTS